jgi:uncharacterized protein (TIGR02147 family)
MTVFEFADYRAFILFRIERMPRRGRGELGRIARHLRLHTTTLSQIVRGTRQLSLEHGVLLCEYLGLGEAETGFFLLLIQWDRAGTPELRRLLKGQLDAIRKSKGELTRQLSAGATIPEDQQAVFYSSWFYSAVRVLSSIPGFQSPESIAERLHLPRKLVNQVADFLVRAGLCVRGPEGLAPGPNYTHLDAASPLVARHHANWRLKAVERHPKLTEDEISYTAPMSVSREDAVKIRRLLVDTVKSIHAIREPSACEAAYFLNLDWNRF